MMESKQDIVQAIDSCIEALNSGANGQEATGDDRFVLETIRKINKLPYKGKNLGVGEIYYSGERSTSEDYIKGFIEKTAITYRLSWLNAILLLYDFANYTEEEILESAKKITTDNIIYNHIIKHIISNFVIQDNIKSAEEFIPNFRETTIWKKEGNLDLGYLIILQHYASKGDEKNFFKYLKLSKPAVNRTEVGDAKFLLVNKFALQNGIEETISLCKHKSLGSNFYFAALTAFAKKGKYQDLKDIFQKYPILKQTEQETELKILVQAYEEAHKRNFSVDDDFQLLFDRTKLVDRKLKWGDVKLQDSIFFDLGMASLGNKKRVVLCRKAIKNNSLKRELIVK